MYSLLRYESVVQQPHRQPFVRFVLVVLKSEQSAGAICLLAPYTEVGVSRTSRRNRRRKRERQLRSAVDI